MYNIHKEMDKRRISLYKQSLMNINHKVDSTSKEIENLRKMADDPMRGFYKNECLNKTEYLDRMHKEWGKRDIISSGPSREYKVDSSVEPTSHPSHDLLRWGLYPHQVQ